MMMVIYILFSPKMKLENVSLKFQVGRNISVWSQTIWNEIEQYDMMSI